MIQLVLDGKGNHSLIRSHNSFRNKGWVEMSRIIEGNIRQGTTLHLVTDNTKPEPHRGSYYLLFMEEYQSIYLFYLDVKGVLRIVYSGNIDSAVSAMYKYVANDTNITILKSNSKRAYRVVRVLSEDSPMSYEVISNTYKNKSSQIISQVYMNFFDAINYAVSCHNKQRNYSYCVISPKGSIMFKVPK